MKPAAARFVFWSPRVLTLLFAVFISLFALDVFAESRGFWATAVALAMHLIPTALVLIVLAVAWRWEWTGAVLFVALAALHIAMFWHRFPLATYLIVSCPLFVTAMLFLLGWIYRAEARGLR